MLLFVYLYIFFFLYITCNDTNRDESGKNEYTKMCLLYLLFDLFFRQCNDKIEN